ncbi:hypothetical protein D9M72_470170 [compost metagenome]
MPSYFSFILKYNPKPVIVCRQVVAVQFAVPTRLSSFKKVEQLAVAVKNSNGSIGLELQVRNPPHIVSTVVIWSEEFRVIHDVKYMGNDTAVGFFYDDCVSAWI